MIDSKSLKNSTGIDEVLKQKQVQLTVIEATPLHHIVSACDAVCGGTESIDQAMDSISLASRNEDHDGTIYELADLAAQSVLNTQDLLKSKVLPHIRSIIDTIEESTKNSKQTGLPYTLEYRDIPFLLTLEPTGRLIEQFANGDQFETQEDVNLGTFSDDEIIEKATYTNDGDFNDLLKAYLLENPEATNTISSVLSGQSFLGNVTDPVTLLALIVVAQNIAGDESQIQSGLNVSLSAFKYRLLWLSIGSAKRLASIIKKWSTDIKNRILFTDVVRRDKVIVVNKSVFANLVDEHGLTVEALIGNEILGRPFTGHGLTVEDNLLKAKAKYDTELSMATRRNDLENDITYTQCIFKTAMDDARARSTDEETLAVLGDTSESLVSRAKLVCERLYAAGVSGKVRDHLVASLVCSIYYAHTDVLMLISIMGDVSKGNPELSSDDVVLVARTEFVAWFVFKQLAVVTTK